jgi:hypothetical protein
MFEVAQAGFLALTRARHGGPQHLTVQHVHVNDGGQAVVAAKLKPGRRRRGSKRRREVEAK